jgi:hypothetical protein
MPAILLSLQEIEAEIAAIEECQKRAEPLEWGRLEASRRVWLNRLVGAKEGRSVESQVAPQREITVPPEPPETKSKTRKKRD